MSESVARKLRVDGRGTGKSDGYWVITFYAADDVPVILIDVYSKSDKVNPTRAERNELRGSSAQSPTPTKPACGPRSCS